MVFQKITVSNLPLLFPIRQILTSVTALGELQTISFPDQYVGIAVSLKITNTSGGNAASYSYNRNPQFSNLAASSFDTLDGTQVRYLSVNTPAAIGESVLVEAQILPIPKNDPPPLEVL
tara:strand:- start:790 stop:1146 length:357 start_codon:yes stop_codon:yes gene_type:complete